MHVIHFIAVKAESKENAFAIVQSELENESHIASDWSDWHVVGGGRWNSNGSQYEDDDSDVISYDEEPEKFIKAINQAKEWRMESIKFDVSRFSAEEFANAANRFIENGGIHSSKDDKYSINNFYARSIAEMLGGYYHSSSFFYDMHNYTSNMEYMLEDPKGYFLVPVDFHH